MIRSIFITMSSVCLCLLSGFFNSALALDPPPKQNISLQVADLNSIPSDSYQVAKATFLPDASESLFSGKTTAYDYNDKNYNKAGTCNDKSSLYTTGNCSYPRAVLASSACPFLPGYYTKCKCLPQFKLTSCNSPYILGGGSCDGKYAACVCPSPVSLTNPNDRCSKYCEGKCIEKTCTPTANQSGCTNGTYNCSNGCGATTRKCCVACSNKVTSKPANSTYTYSSCYDGTTKQIQTGWKCNSGYHQKGNTCEKDCTANSCSGYSLSSCPTNGSCSSCSKQTTTCNGGGTYYKFNGCNSGYHASGTSCVAHSYSCPSGYQSSACSGSQTQTGTKSATCSCGATSGICYACRDKTCAEKGMKDCNGTCIATTDCCGGCGTGKKCSNGTCVAACTANSCSGYSLSSCPANGNCSSCSVVNSDCSSGGTKYKLDSCASGYDKSGNSCVKKTCAVKTCEGYTLSTCPTGANCSTCTIANSDCTTGATMYKITSCKSGYDAVYVDINKTTIRSCRKSGGLIGDLTPVPGGTTCAGDSKWTTCNGKRCCCPKDKGCDTNSLRKWCFCTMSDPDLAVDTNHGVSCPGGGRGSSCACGGMHSGIGFAGAHYCTSIR